MLYNDIYKSSSILNFLLFADDTTILHSHKSLDTLINEVNKELDKVNDWFMVNKLSLNVSKTNFIIFKKNIASSNPAVIIMNTNIIKQVTSTKFLGVLINSEIGWKEHISAITMKISRALGVISRIRYGLTAKTCMLL